MYLLKQIYNQIECLDEMTIYERINDSWVLNQTIKIKNSKDLFNWLKNNPLRLDYAVIKLNQPYRNTFYWFNPHIKIIIDKDEIISLFYAVMGGQRQAYEEAAVSIEEREYHYFKSEGCYFIDDFYNMTSKDSASKLYELWQNDMPLNDKKISKLIRVMEFYFDEIMNYFDATEIIKA